MAGLLAGAVFMAGCSDSQQSRHAASEGEQEHYHYHEAPHGGTAVVLGKEDFHIEFVRDAAVGKMQAYILDGHMHEFVRIPLASFEVAAKLPDREETLNFKAVSKRETGETVGNTALFEAEAEWLKTIEEFDGVVKQIEIRGKQYQTVLFHFPDGNENQK